MKKAITLTILILVCYDWLSAHDSKGHYVAMKALVTIQRALA
jgi:hypothetical protein